MISIERQVFMSKKYNLTVCLLCANKTQVMSRAWKKTKNLENSTSFPSPPSKKALATRTRLIKNFDHSPFVCFIRGKSSVVRFFEQSFFWKFKLSFSFLLFSYITLKFGPCIDTWSITSVTRCNIDIRRVSWDQNAQSHKRSEFCNMLLLHQYLS
jgi:hypothetical protein